MTLTLTWQNILLPILVIAAIAVMIYLCVVLAKLKETLKKVDLVLDDAKKIIATANDITEKADNTVNGVSESMTSVVSSIASNKDLIKNVSGILGIATSVIGLKKVAGRKSESKAAAKAATKAAAKAATKAAVKAAKNESKKAKKK